MVVPAIVRLVFPVLYSAMSPAAQRVFDIDIDTRYMDVSLSAPKDGTASPLRRHLEHQRRHRKPRRDRQDPRSSRLARPPPSLRCPCCACCSRPALHRCAIHAPLEAQGSLPGSPLAAPCPAVRPVLAFAPPKLGADPPRAPTRAFHPQGAKQAPSLCLAFALFHTA